MKIVCLSDIHGELKYLDSLGGEIASSDLVVLPGDISGTGSGSSMNEVLSRIKSMNSRILAVHGNWDGREAEDVLSASGYSLHRDGRMFGGIGFFGVGGSCPTPMNTPVEYSEEEIGRYLLEGYEKIKDAPVKILVSHAPPRNTRDRTFFGMRAGSRSIREFIIEHSVGLCLTGHIHESHGMELLGSCIIANPGSFQKGRYLVVNTGAAGAVDINGIVLKKI